MKNPLWILSGVFGLIAVVALMMWAYGINLHPTQVMVIGAFFIIALVIAILVKVLNIRDISGWFSGSSVGTKDMEKAEQVVRDFWKRQRGEELDYREAHGSERSFGKDTVYGFLMHRVPIMGKGKSGLPVAFVVRSNPLRIVRWSDHPSPEEQDNPFLIWSAGYTGAPVPGLTPEMDPAFQGLRYGGSRPSQTIHIGSRSGDMEDFLDGRRKDER